MASKVVLVVVFVFDLIAFALAVAAEQRRSKAKIEKSGDSSICVYDKDIATGLGIGAIILLASSQVIIMCSVRCWWSGKPLRPTGSRSLTIFLYVASWILYGVAMSCLLGATVTNAVKKSQKGSSCDIVRKGYFAAGAVFVVLTGIVTEIFYARHSKAEDAQENYNRGSGIRMGNV